MVEAICGGLSSWKSDEAYVVSGSSPGVRLAVAQQTTIGWDSMLEGCLAVSWRKLQGRFYGWVQSRRSSKRWTASLIHKLWLVAWDQWEHRNGIVHKVGERTTNSEESQLDKAIKRQKRRGGGRRLHPRDRSLFDTPLKRLLRMNVDDKKGWQESMAVARRRRFSGPQVPSS